MGIAMIEVLSHNGVISPSDIKEGASSLKDITYDVNADKYITNYQAVQAYTELNSYEQFLVYNQTYEEKIDKLISTAEKCMNENKYFLITLRGENFAHAVCGIGVADGNWTFKDHNYDKCILVLDSNAKNIDREPIGFSNEICIYINSQTKQSYIPFYDRIFTDGYDLGYVVIDDDTLLNNKGVINPSEKINTDISGIKSFLYAINDSSDIKVYGISKDSSNANNVIIEDMGDKKYFKADVIKLEIENGKASSRNYRYIDSDRWIDLELINNEEEGRKFKYNCDFELSDEKIVVNNKNNSPLHFDTIIRMNDGTYNFAPYYEWVILGQVKENLEVEILDKGMLFKSDGVIDLSITPSYYTLDEKGNFKELHAFLLNENYSAYLCTDNNVLLSIDENKEISYYIDVNNDNVYDTRVQKGDINCDGKIDAVDASKIMSIYTKLSVSEKNYIDYSLGDINNDSRIDSIDASIILKKYAELSTL